MRIRMTATAILLVTTVSFQARAQTGQAASSSADGPEVTLLSNEYRMSEGMGRLEMDPTLSKIAEDYAADMLHRDFFDHVTPDGQHLGDRLARGHAIYRAAGENIARGQKDPESVMRAWMNSPGHRKNIMNPKYKKIGIGHAGDRWVMHLTD